MPHQLFTPAVMLAFCCGICLAVMPYGLACYIPLAALDWLLLSYFSVLLVLMVIWKSQSLVVLWLAVFVSGLLWGLGSAAETVNRLLPVTLDDETFIVTGKITGLPRSINQFNRAGQQFEVAVEQWHCEKKLQQCKDINLSSLRLRWYGSQTVEAGEIWEFAVQLRRPRGLASPAAKSFDVWLIAQGISATGKVLSGRRLAAPDDVYAWRQSLSNLIRHELAGYSQAGILEALINGNNAAIAAAQWQVFADTNTTHLFVISGLHLSLMGGCCWWLLRRLLMASGRFSPFVSITLASLLAWSLTAVYAFVAGWTLPVQRSLGVFTIVMLLLISRRTVRALQLFLLLLTITLAVDPVSIYSSSFWLSWVSAAVLIIALAGRQNASMIMQWWRSQFAITLGLSPLLVFIAGQMSLLGFFANALAIPLVNLLVVPLDLLALAVFRWSPELSHWLWFCLNLLLQNLMDFLQWMIAHGQAYIFNPVTASVALVFFAGSAIVCILPKALPSRWLFLPGFLPIIFWPEPLLPDDELALTIFDVGQGLAVMIQVADHVLLYDTGPQMGETLDAGAAIILPYLYRQGLRHIDTLVVSHADNDHAGGVASIVKKINPKDVFSGEKIPGLNSESCQHEKSWSWRQFYFEFINPDLHPAVKSGFFTIAGNNRSCVLRISRNDKPETALLMLTGDIERQVEYYLLRHHRAELRSEVLLMPHHGSRTSSSTEFVHAVDPQWAIASAGYRHRFGHPHKDTVDRYRRQGAEILNTAETGTISMHWVSGQWRVDSLYRQQPRYFWQ